MFAVRTLPQSVLAYIRREGLLRAGDRLGLAVSGGADSVALLRIMLELREELGIVLSVVHFNHKLRGAEAEADAEFVTRLAHRHESAIARRQRRRCGACAQPPSQYRGCCPRAALSILSASCLRRIL